MISVRTLSPVGSQRLCLGILAMMVALTTGPLTAQHQMETITLKDIRGMRYCEMLLIYDDRVEIYNTSANDGCPADKWQAMDVAEIADNHGAKAAQLNGPKFWVADDQTIELGETKTIGGIDARYGATLPVSELCCYQVTWITGNTLGLVDVAGGATREVTIELEPGYYRFSVVAIDTEGLTSEPSESVEADLS